MNDKGCTLRPMDRRDVSGVLEVHLEAFEGFFLTTLGPRFLRRYYSAAIEDESTVAFVATDRSDVVGFVIGSFNPSGFYNRLLRRQAIWFALDALPAMMRNPLTIARLWRARQKPQEYQAEDDVGAVFSFAVAPATQRMGVGAALLDCLERDMIANGARRVTLETDGVNNQSVQRFYEKAGFIATRYYETREGRQMVEFTKVLDPPAGGIQ